MKVKLRKFLYFLSFLGWPVFPNMFFVSLKNISSFGFSEPLNQNQKVQRKNTSHKYSSTPQTCYEEGKGDMNCPLQPQLHPSPSEPPDAALRQKELYSRLSARQIVQKQTATMHPKFTGLLLDFTSMSWLQRQRQKKSPAGDEEPVAPAGTCPHKGLSVLSGK